MKLKEFIRIMEEIAPPELALPEDNIGLLVGPDHDEIKSVLVALDCTPVTAKEAADIGADLLVTHHPVFMRGIKRLLPDDPETAGAYILARHGIGLYAAHTNLDTAAGGVNDALAAALGIRDAEPIGAERMGRVGFLEKPVTLDAFAALVAKSLGAAVRVCGDGGRLVSRVAVLGGGGGEDIRVALLAGADAYVTGECKHRQALFAGVWGIPVIEAGHYETERVALLPLIKRLQELAPGVQYNLTRCEKPSLRGL